MLGDFSFCLYELLLTWVNQAETRSADRGAHSLTEQIEHWAWTLSHTPCKPRALCVFHSSRWRLPLPLTLSARPPPPSPLPSRRERTTLRLISAVALRSELSGWYQQSSALLLPPARHRGPDKSPGEQAQHDVKHWKKEFVIFYFSFSQKARRGLKRGIR